MSWTQTGSSIIFLPYTLEEALRGLARAGFTNVEIGAVKDFLEHLDPDDPDLLRHAQGAKEVGRDPRVTEYEPGFGPSASYYAWEAAGRPVHGIRAQ